MTLPLEALVDPYVVREADDVVFPVQVVERGVPDVPLSLMHSAAHRFLARGTALKYCAGQRALFASPTFRSLVRSGSLPILGTRRQFRTLVSHVLEQDHGAVLTAAKSGEDAFYVEVEHARRDRVKSMLLGGRVGLEALLAYGVFNDGNPFHSDDAALKPVFLGPKTERFRVSDAEMRARLFGRPSHFRLAGLGWTPRPRLVETSVGDLYARAVSLALPPGVLLILRIAIESGARVSEVLELTFEDWFVDGVFGVDMRAKNKGSRGRRTKVIRVSPGCVRAAMAYASGDRVRFDGRGRGFEDFRRAAVEGRTDDLRVPIVLTRLREGYSYNGFLHHFAKLQDGDPEVVAHDCRHEFVNRNLDRLWALYGHDDELLKRHTDRLIDYMAWSTRERMLWVYSARHRRARDAQLAVDMHRPLVDEAGAIDAAYLDVAPLPVPEGVRPVPVEQDATDDFLDFEEEFA